MQGLKRGELELLMQENRDYRLCWITQGRLQCNAMGKGDCVSFETQWSALEGGNECREMGCERWVKLVVKGQVFETTTLQLNHVTPCLTHA